MVYSFLSVLRGKFGQRIAFDLLEGADLNFLTFQIKTKMEN